ncbi:MAG: flagellar basal body L-ring protein FlgH [Wenzhouxiangellaceae bacterium]|nr:flagellar basal body L-ring protein FlgH [Wenzhouxiangellaceae bacterium]
MNIRVDRIAQCSALLLALLLTGCAAPPGPDDWGPFEPLAPVPVSVEERNGAIYHDATAQSLFSDVKAHRVGDTLTVVLAERTSATSSASTSTQRETSTGISNPILFGEAPTRGGGIPLFQSSLDSNNAFEGDASSSQSNSVIGNISVTVYQRLPNGNLVVRGEKWVRVNQGRERLRVAGIVRPADINADNSVPSFKLADARIDYSERGALGDANRPGWLTRFFQSPIFPF